MHNAAFPAKAQSHGQPHRLENCSHLTGILAIPRIQADHMFGRGLETLGAVRGGETHGKSWQLHASLTLRDCGMGLVDRHSLSESHA